jgi:hypothetical protein
MVKLYHTIRRFTPCPSHWANAININFEHLSREKARAKVAEIRVLLVTHGFEVGKQVEDFVLLQRIEQSRRHE